MTAEIAILNREAVALAADSAVTADSGSGGPSKIFPSANKIFALSHHEPVGVMVFGAADLFGVPWETTIKMYRESCGNRSFPRLEDYALDLIAYMNGNRDLFPEPKQTGFVVDTATAFISGLREALDGEVAKVIQQRGSISKRQVTRTLRRIVATADQIVRTGPDVPSVPSDHFDRLQRQYGSDLRRVIREVLGSHPLGSELRAQLVDIVTRVFIKFPEGFRWNRGAGVVVAGFGREDVFPRLYAYEVGGMAGDLLRYREISRMEVDHDGGGAGIAPFAQREMVERFMEGVDPRYEDEIEEAILRILTDYPAIVLNLVPRLGARQRARIQQALRDTAAGVMDRMRHELATKRRTLFVNPVVSTVDLLPKDELAAMAESLVNLTSVKRRVSMEKETVGGPIDVAVISKGDGFIWIKRKHYFPADANPQYFARVYGRTT